MTGGAKVCTRCGVVKPLSGFSRDRSRPSGFTPACRECRAGSRQAWGVSSGYRWCRSEFYRQPPRKPRAVPERDERRVWRLWRRWLRDEVLFAVPSWEWSHAKVCSGKHSLCGELKPLASFEAKGGGDRAAYCKACGNVSLRPRYRLREQRRRAREAGAAGRRTVAQTEARFAFYGNRCAYCRAEGDLVVEHVIPLARGGSEWPANIRPACIVCNTDKGVATLSEWLAAA